MNVGDTVVVVDPAGVDGAVKPGHEGVVAEVKPGFGVLVSFAYIGVLSARESAVKVVGS